MAFDAEKRLFPMQAGGKAAQTALCGKNSVTRNQYRDGIGAQRPSDGPLSLRAADARRQSRIAFGCAPGNRPGALPHRTLEWRPHKVQRNVVKIHTLPRNIGFQQPGEPCARFRNRWNFLRIAVGCAKFKPSDALG